MQNQQDVKKTETMSNIHKSYKMLGSLLGYTQFFKTSFCCCFSTQRSISIFQHLICFPVSKRDKGTWPNKQKFKVLVKAIYKLLSKTKVY